MMDERQKVDLRKAAAALRPTQTGRATIEEAQRYNAAHMDDGQLRRELWLVESYHERPAIRVAWIEVLREEIARREAEVCPS